MSFMSVVFTNIPSRVFTVVDEEARIFYHADFFADVLYEHWSDETLHQFIPVNDLTTYSSLRDHVRFEPYDLDVRPASSFITSNGILELVKGWYHHSGAVKDLMFSEPWTNAAECGLLLRHFSRWGYDHEREDVFEMARYCHCDSPSCTFRCPPTSSTESINIDVLSECIFF